MRNAKLEAMGISPPEQRQHRNDRPQMATDDMVCRKENLSVLAYRVAF